MKDEKVSEALALFNNAELDWITLYKIYETVRDDKPNNSTSTDYKNLIDPERKRFRDTANYQHRQSMFSKKAKKPENPMSLSEAEHFISKSLFSLLVDKTIIINPTQKNKRPQTTKQQQQTHRHH